MNRRVVHLYDLILIGSPCLHMALAELIAYPMGSDQGWYWFLHGIGALCSVWFCWHVAGHRDVIIPAAIVCAAIFLIGAVTDYRAAYLLIVLPYLVPEFLVLPGKWWTRPAVKSHDLLRKSGF